MTLVAYIGRWAYTDQCDLVVYEVRPEYDHLILFHDLDQADDEQLIKQARALLAPTYEVGPFAGPVARVPGTLDMRAELHRV